MSATHNNQDRFMKNRLLLPFFNAFSIRQYLDLRYVLSRLLHRTQTRPVGKGLSAEDRQVSFSAARTFEVNPDEMRRVFEKIDRDGDKRISAEELRWVLQALDAGSDDVEGMMRAAGADKDGLVGFGEFMEVNRRVKAGDIQMAFRVFDRDGDGRVGAEDVMDVLTRLGESCSWEECRRMVSAVGRSGDGMVDMDDFMAMMTCTLKPA